MRLCGISSDFSLLSPNTGQVPHALLTRPPLTFGASSSGPFDLHVLSTPPAFILSQDQTLCKSVITQDNDLAVSRHYCFCGHPFQPTRAEQISQELCKEFFENRMCFTVRLSKYGAILTVFHLQTALSASLKRPAFSKHRRPR